MKDLDYPRKIICMTEESVEWIYKLGQESRLIGVSAYVERPVEAKGLPTISAFTHANIKKIVSMKPDLVLGFSDIQKDIAKDLIGEGINVWISNHRSLEEVFDYLLALGSMLGEREKSLGIISEYREKIESVGEKNLPQVPIYLEEWDDPMISGIRYFSELAEVCGLVDVFKEKSRGSLAKERFVTSEDVVKANPEAILACWCGKKVDLDSFIKRPGWKEISAVKNKNIFELDPAVFLQPGPALFEDGLDQLLELRSKLVLPGL